MRGMFVFLMGSGFAVPASSDTTVLPERTTKNVDDDDIAN
jgi:hypothetical protein